jgi:AcrR family transcriptional regulator
MAMQDRAIRTRRKILEAAATVFEQQGFRAATITEILALAGLTKGSLYFHFKSKEELARAILDAQTDIVVPPQRIKLQELADSGLVLAHRLQTDPLVRASVHLALQQHTVPLNHHLSFQVWSEQNRQLLLEARDQGEILPHVDIEEAAQVLVGAFAGIQAMSQAMSDYRDLPERVTALLRLVFPSLATPSVLAQLDLSPDRSARLVDEDQEEEADSPA